MSNFGDQITTARAKAQWDIWKDNLIQMEINLSKSLGDVYLSSGTVRKKKEIELAAKIVGLYSLLRAKLSEGIKFPNRKKFEHLLELDKLDPDNPPPLKELRKFAIELFAMIDALGYTRVEEIQHEEITPQHFGNL